ncbi:MAG: MBL fold metallo-hydrolase [Verrucomicrobia bacterium]|nr:MBL fold metallo-hydrolase [Verrucomicrobiota bacterium]
MRVEAFEVNHWGARWRRDTHRGYNGYILEHGGKKVIFGGDTALCQNFASLRGKGPFDVACKPIGAYAPWVCSHCTPEEAVSMADAAGARRFAAIHHRTFRLGREGKTEPLERLETALQKEPDGIALREVGETFSLS